MRGGDDQPVVLEIHDDGGGSPTSRAIGRGTGLGLRLVRALVEEELQGQFGLDPPRRPGQHRHRDHPAGRAGGPRAWPRCGRYSPPLQAELAARIQATDPRAEVLFEPDLLPPARYPADHVRDPAFRRDPEGEVRRRALLDWAEVLFGVPDDSAEGLAEAVNGLPGLRWVHATSAGAGEQVRKADLAPEALERVAVITSSGVHAVPLAEFAVLGLLAVAKDLPQLVDQRAKARGGPPALPGAVRRDPLLVGLGEIGREVARSWARPWHAHGQVPAPPGPAPAVGRRGRP